MLAFLPATLLAYYLAPQRWRNVVALAASLFFYAWGAPKFLFVLLASSLVDFGVSHAMGTPAGPIRQAQGRPRALPDGSAGASQEQDGAAVSQTGRDRRRRKAWLILGLVVNLSAFFFFKYANFFVGEFSRLLGSLGLEPVAWTAIALPIGISFFTFQKLSYLVDVYRGVVAPARSPVHYLLYVSLFPQLIAGPIVRYHDITAQLDERQLRADRLFSGLWRFCRGLARKVLIANVLGEVANHAFALGPAELGMGHAWIGILCYTFQIYFDFAGYSDMAIGLGRLLGFEFLENFNCPYVARDFGDFWRRWHISLSNWMREYLYVPLGGNRGGPARTYANLWVVFVLSGLWHGASWNFVVWGCYHGLFLCLAKLGRQRLARVPSVLAVPSTFLLVMLGWVFFRAETLPAALAYLGCMLGVGGAGPGADAGAVLNPQALVILLLAMLLSFGPALRQGYARFTRFWASPAAGVAPLVYAGALVLLVLSISALASGGFNPFIYFRF